MSQADFIIEGRCLSGKDGALKICPDSRLNLYLYEDSHKPVKIPVDIEQIMVRDHLVSIGKTKTISIVEHLFSALYGLGLFNVRIDFLSDEIPFFDGSSRLFVERLKRLPFSEPLRFNLKQKIMVADNDSYILYEPSMRGHSIIEMELRHPYIGSQVINLQLTRSNYIKEIAPARTFVFTENSDPRLNNLPSYGFAITESGIFAKEPLRFPDEPVRHKVLDLLGDLYFLGGWLEGRIQASNTSHQLNLKFLKVLNSYLSQ